jgi:hypothetical protein
MKMGLRRETRSTVADRTNPLVRNPDEDGIETSPMDAPCPMDAHSLVRNPDEDGIETLPFDAFSSAASNVGEKPR